MYFVFIHELQFYTLQDKSSIYVQYKNTHTHTYTQTFFIKISNICLKAKRNSTSKLGHYICGWIIKEMEVRLSDRSTRCLGVRQLERMNRTTTCMNEQKTSQLIQRFHVCMHESITSGALEEDENSAFEVARFQLRGRKKVFPTCDLECVAEGKTQPKIDFFSRVVHAFRFRSCHRIGSGSSFLHLALI